MANAPLEVVLRSFFFLLRSRVRRRQRRVQLEHRQLGTCRLATGLTRRLRPHAEFPRACYRDRRAQPSKARRVDRVDHPARRRVRRDIPEQGQLLAQPPVSLGHTPRLASITARSRDTPCHAPSAAPGFLASPDNVCVSPTSATPARRRCQHDRPGHCRPHSDLIR